MLGCWAVFASSLVGKGCIRAGWLSDPKAGSTLKASWRENACMFPEACSHLSMRAAAREGMISTFLLLDLNQQ